MSVFLGRAVADGEPVWLPEDRDVVAVWQQLQRSKHDACGRWAWEYDETFEDLFEVDFEVCPFCRDVGEKAEMVVSGRQSMHGVRFGFYPVEVAGGD